MRNLVLGGAGLVGTNLSKKLIESGEEVAIVDRDLSRVPTASGYTCLEADLVNERKKVFLWVKKEFKPADKLNIWHLAANSDIRAGINDPFVDYKDTLGSTLTAIEIGNLLKPCFLGFSSSSAVYGDKRGFPVNESSTDLEPISNYGLMKLWSEKLVLDFLSRNKETQVLIYRFPNVVGLPLTHGVVKDLFEKLRTHPLSVDVLGNGRQRKQYVHVEDLVEVIINLKRGGHTHIFNIAPNDHGVFVREIAELLRDSVSSKTQLNFGETEYGWKGDVPTYFLETQKLKEAGYGQNFNSLEAVERTIREIGSQG